ncbi:MAG TPA: response regulator [Desulfobacteraceae bacterium]|nr:response regulator [Desulfobacteraceae bacterium]HPJ67320.1 response regulator [Desulfobacteraceae bacterium]
MSDDNIRKKILIVDDDISFVNSVQELLENENYLVLKAYNGEEGLELAKKEHPDLMILDVMMTHNTEGFEISREIVKIPDLKQMYVILLTGITKEMNLPFKFEPDETLLPVSIVLEKPVAPGKLLNEIKERIG